tara:strand:+ start:185 stop:1345 length:1161 start_codon:yes stop_codon:yes gene_type:complete
LKIQTNKVFKHLQRSKKKIIVEQGGTRSGKTYNILLWIIFDYCVNNKKKVITICRKSLPTVRATVMRDFMNILKDTNIYTTEKHNMSKSEYLLFGNLIEFISLDQSQKVRGRKRDLLFINEANELGWEDFQQLLFRTQYRIIIDYNPSDEFHWIYDKVITRDDTDFFKTTYKDNPFLEQTLITEIERLRDTDENYWNVYGMGERGVSQSLIFSNVSIIEKIPENATHLAYGLDFGYAVDPTALIQIFKQDDNLYFKELIYECGLTNIALSKRFTNIGLVKHNSIFADNSEPKSIAEIHRFGWNIKAASKGKDSINIGIDLLRRNKLFVTKDSINVIKEFRSYKYETNRDGIILPKPIDANNHSIDAIRYGCIMTLTKPNFGKYHVH